MSKIPPPPAPKKKTKKTPEPAATRRWVDVTLDAFTVEGERVSLPIRRLAGPPRPGVPPVDLNYHFRAEQLRELLWAVWPHDGGAPTPAVMVGPKGCGKTSLILQLAARCNVRVHRINLHVGTTTRHLKGRVGARDGETVFVPGVATTAMEEGDWLVLDELSGATPPVALALFPILEPDGSVVLEDAEPPRYVKRHPDFRVFATDNAIGAEQEEHRFSYAGTNQMNVALLDRFGATIQAGYLDPDAEFDLLTKVVPGMAAEVAEAERVAQQTGASLVDTPNMVVLEGMIRVAKDIRMSDAIGVAFSTRMLLDWARRWVAGPVGGGTYKPAAVLEIAYPAFLNKVPSVIERDAIVEVIRRTFKIAPGDLVGGE